ncbi:hypothetical protein BX616_011204 [Lobosporangium transversale]|uniref:Methyltransferase domain-containing protein n=1 Tax=Lobosporangium transversale TaxID=64571 RepID=A0A1Y2GCX8_9FUNG|nr:hypothetical protein BCR41DRAFT_373719 [Lobosporangium transversale]KAF9909386.1 hypothetical protein BX616_011204 [Lobosporangium transversale]ORZ07291.1 hypothetical protein BCR41DRAFT_373719 [Lobosporangium transversale]|eukprot:XP_021877954.1 hypothetical protein BCR41DRAFT_373719 [Lobosporangium transversale]
MNGIQGTFMQRQKSGSRSQHLPHPLDQAEFYTLASSTSLTATNRAADQPPHSPASPSFSIPSSATTPTSASYQGDLPYPTTRYDGETISATASPTSQRHPSYSNPSLNQHHSTPIIISPQRHNYTSTSNDDNQPVKSSASTNMPSRRGSEHHQHHQQQQQQPTSDLHLLGTSPEAKDWLKQKPTRSSAHMIHQYNFQSHPYYQQPGSIAVKIVNNTCRNMSDYPNVPSIPSPGTRLLGNGVCQTPTTTLLNGSSYQRSKSISAVSNNENSTLAVNGSRTYVSAPIPSSRSRGMSQPETMSPSQLGPQNDSSNGLLHAQGVSSHKTLQEPRVGKLVMSRSKLASPLATSVSPVTTSNLMIPSPLGSPLETSSPNGYLTSETDSYASSTPLVSRQRRLSSTLSSLRSLIGNHPQGLSLIDSLEEEEDDDLESLSETETGDSETDLVQRTQSLTTVDTPVIAEPTSDSSVTPPSQEKRNVRKRPPPRLEWMADRRRFSVSSLSTINRDIQDSQKGQHALWKYIGGGNSHAPLRFDIDRILDSGCGLGEWTMEMAKEFPNATVYGIDINPELFPSAQQPVPSNCLFTQSNLLTRLSFPNKYFDFVYQRFLYLGLTVDDWPVALKELKRVMKPGGYIELFEPCMRVHRAGARTREVMRWCSRLLQEERGLDFDFAGEKMKRLCESEEIGFQNVRLERLSIPVGGWGGRVGQAMAENMVLIFQNLQSALMPDDTTQTPNGPAQKAFDNMVQSWVRECEENKSYIDYYILVGQRPME